MQNNITITSQSKDEERDTKLWKVAVLAVLGLGANLLATYALTTYLATANSDLLFVVVGAALIGVVVLVLQALFVKSPMLLRAVVLIETLGPLVFFVPRLFPEPSIILIAAAFLFFFFANMGSLRGLRQAATSIAVHFFETARTVVPKVLTGGLLFMTALIYLTYFSWGTLNVAVGRRFVNQVLSSSDPVLRLYFSRVSVDQTVEEFLHEVVRSQIEGEKNNILGSLVLDEEKGFEEFRNLPVPAREEIITRVTKSFRESLEPIVGLLDGAEPVRDAVYRILEERFSSLSPSQHTTFSIGGLILVFFAFKGFLSLFHWLIAVVAFLVFKLLMALGFAKTGLSTQSREFIILS
ncbi:MAG: hypothetical protein Q8P88_03040 [Candidatus Jorgensenbacteria bacterium]|nr:hypothetical protein [Candidatus Jorgensenbacteria bacterium]